MTTLDRHVGSIEVTLDLEFGLSDLNDLCSSVGVGSILLYLTILGLGDLNNLCSSVDPASLLLYLTNLARKRRSHIPMALRHSLVKITGSILSPEEI